MVPAYNAALTIEEQLDALLGQSYTGSWELIVVDNASVDETIAASSTYLHRFEDMAIVSASDSQGAAFARNTGARSARAPLLAFCDADDRVEKEWLASIVAGLESADFVTGSIDHVSLNPGATGGHWKSHVESLPTALRFLPYALSGNMGVRKSIFEEVGGFPEDLDAVGEDVAFSWEAQIAGYQIEFVSEAVVAYRHRVGNRDLWRQHYGFGQADVALYKRYHQYGVPRPKLKTVLAAYVRLIAKLPRLLDQEKRPTTLRSLAKRCGRITGSLRMAVFYP